jgi:hypothetical protein
MAPVRPGPATLLKGLRTAEVGGSNLLTSRILLQNRLIEPRARKTDDYRRSERARPMELWQLDV